MLRRNAIALARQVAGPLAKQITRQDGLICSAGYPGRLETVHRVKGTISPSISMVVFE